MKKAPTNRANAAKEAANAKIAEPTPPAENDDMRAEYDFRGGVRGKYAAQFAEGTNLVLLDPDVARAFPNATAVNDALRALAGIIERSAAQHHGKHVE
jgi:hypothetical protein